MLDVICWLWAARPRYRTQFTPSHVNVLHRMVRRHYAAPHRFSVVTDMVDAPFDSQIRVIPLWSDYADLPSVWGAEAPSCFRRLKAFSPEMRQVIGERFVSIDLDCVIVGDLAPLFDREEDFIIWGEDGRRTPYNGSMWMMRAGARAQVWERFRHNPNYILDRARGAGYYGSDQAVISYVLGRDEPRWTSRDGVFSYRVHVRGEDHRLPQGARVVFFEGNYDPWDPDIQRKAPWIVEHYR